MQTNAPATTRDASPAPQQQTLKTLIASYREQFAKVLPRHLSADRFVRVALTALTRTPKLMECDQASFFKSLLALSELGIEPDGRRAHLIPFNNTKRQCVECQLIVDYKGLVELAMRSGQLSNIHADVVCENDVFDYDCGHIARHSVDFRKPRGIPYAAYAIARFKDGSDKCEVMGVEEIEAVRRRSRAGKDGPWVTDWSEMAKKSAFRRLAKWLPLSSEFRDAVESEDEPIGNSTPAIDILPPEPIQIAQEAETSVPAQENRDKIASEDTPQGQLAKLVTESGFTLDQLLKWGAETKLIPNADSIASFDEIHEKICVRLLRARAGMLQGLAAVKGEAAP